MLLLPVSYNLQIVVGGGGIAQSVASLSATRSVLVRARYDPFQKGGTLSLCYELVPTSADDWFIASWLFRQYGETAMTPYWRHGYFILDIHWWVILQCIGIILCLTFSNCMLYVFQQKPSAGR